MLKRLCKALESVFDTEGSEEDFSDLQKAYGLLLSVSKIDGTHVPEQVRMLPLALALSRIHLSVILQFEQSIARHPFS